MAATNGDGRQLLSALEGRRCPSCRTGSLVRDRYKGNLAALCEECGTPQAQLW
ncbi:HVO_A0556 family zinc finger protein [Natrialbaceae archaeon A-CW3]